MGLRTAEKNPSSTDQQIDYSEDTADEAPRREEDVPKESRGHLPNLVEGQRVRVDKGDYAGRMGYVLRINYADDAAWTQASLPGHPRRAFADVESYVIRTRDARTDTFRATRDELTPLDDVEGWGRGSV